MSQSRKEQIKELIMEAYDGTQHRVRELSEDERKEHRERLGVDGTYDTDEQILNSKSVIGARGDGGKTSYYDIPKGATQLRHLIKHKKMEHGIGEAFCALYRLNDNGEYERNLRKVYDYIVAELEYLSNCS